MTTTTNSGALSADDATPALPSLSTSAESTSPHAWWALKVGVAAADSLTVVTSGLLGLWFATSVGPVKVEGGQVAFAAACVPLWVGVLARFGLYRSGVIASRIEEFTHLARAVLSSALVMVVLAFALRLDVSRGWLAFTTGIALLALTVERKLVRELLVRWRRKYRRFLRPAVVVGGNREAVRLCRALGSDPYLGYHVVGFVTDTVPEGVPDVPVLGSLDDACEVVRAVGASHAVIATSAVDLDRSDWLVRELSESGVQVEVSSALSEVAANRIAVRPLDCFPMLHIEAVRRRGWRGFAKRALDLAGSVALVVALSLALLVAAILIKLDSRGPVFFRQVRLGRDGALFRVWKLRTMTSDAESRLDELRIHNEVSAPLFKMREDPRVTRVGRLLRRLSLDEVPQLFNVMKGEMSLVGPRPALPAEAEHWSPELRARLHVKPGLTGMWQVRGRGRPSFEEYVRLDLYYVYNWSLWSDLAILAKTVPTVLFRRGAY